MKNLSPSRAITGLRALLILSPVHKILSPILHFVPEPLCDWPQGGDNLSPSVSWSFDLSPWHLSGNKGKARQKHLSPLTYSNRPLPAWPQAVLSPFCPLMDRFVPVLEFCPRPQETGTNCTQAAWALASEAFL